MFDIQRLSESFPQAINLLITHVLARLPWCITKAADVKGDGLYLSCLLWEQ